IGQWGTEVSDDRESQRPQSGRHQYISVAGRAAPQGAERDQGAQQAHAVSAPDLSPFPDAQCVGAVKDERGERKIPQKKDRGNTDQQQGDISATDILSRLGMGSSPGQ